METINNDDKHTVSFTSIDYHSMCQKSKDRIQRMRKEGMATSHDPKDKPEDVTGKGSSYSIIFMS